jgi:hypothetical protein
MLKHHLYVQCIYSFYFIYHPELVKVQYNPSVLVNRDCDAIDVRITEPH